MSEQETTTRAQMLETIKATGEDPEKVFCIYQNVPSDGYRPFDFSPYPLETCPATALPERKFCPGYGGVEGEPVIGFGERYIYVKACYDGSEWITAIPKEPRFVTPGSIPEVGGG